MKKLAALLITIFAFTAFGFTFFPDDETGPDEFGPKAKLIEDLKLTEEQQAKLSDLRYTHQKQMIDTRAEIQKNMLEVKKMMDDNNVDEGKLLKLTEANNNLRSKIHTSRVNMWLDVYKILNKEQQELWTKHFAGMGERMHTKIGRERGLHNGPGMGLRFRDFKDDDFRPRDGRGRF